MRNSLLFLSLAGALALLSPLPADAARTWHVQGGDVTVAFDDGLLASLGLSVIGERSTASLDEGPRRLSGVPRSFGFETPELAFHSEQGVFRGVVGSTRVVLPFRGGLGFAARDPQTGTAHAPVFLYDGSVAVDFANPERPLELRTADGTAAPLEVLHTGLVFREDVGELGYYFADLKISEAGAHQLGRPDLAGTWIGGMEVRLRASTTDLEPRTAVAPEVAAEEAAAPLDLLLNWLWDIGVAARSGLYPNGLNGLSAATNSCNAGGSNIPWNGPMGETHPFIGLALFRLKDGVLEQVGKNWVKHGFFALSNNECGFGCTGSDGSYMGVGCSDTYSFSNNSSQFYLGPRDEVDPYLGTWEACGSLFDDGFGAPDADCARDYSGISSGDPHHRVEVWDEDLGNPGATYFYEGVYYLANDGAPENNIGWRQCSMSWTGTSWNFSTVGGGLTDTQGTVIQTWGDESHVKDVASDDGPVILAVDVTDLGGGNWHYEYALYNWRSQREVYSFSVPIGGASVTNIGFHDLDKVPGNDWTPTVAGGFVTWATDDFATDPDANAIEYQSMYNFRFDANVGPKADLVQGGIFKPGVGTTFFVDAQVPDGGAVDAPVVAAGRASFGLHGIEPSPFRNSTRVGFSLPRQGRAKLSVVDVTGRTVRVLLDGEAPAGAREAVWDGRDASGRPVSSGVYLVRLESEDGVRTAKVARIR